MAPEVRYLLSPYTDSNSLEHSPTGRRLTRHRNTESRTKRITPLGAGHCSLQMAYLPPEHVPHVLHGRRRTGGRDVVFVDFHNYQINLSAGPVIVVVVLLLSVPFIRNGSAAAPTVHSVLPSILSIAAESEDEDRATISKGGSLWREREWMWM